MTALDSVASTAELIGGIAADVSTWIPAPGSVVANFISVGAKAVAYVVHAVEGHPDPGDTVSVLAAALRLASDEQLKAELGP